MGAEIDVEGVIKTTLGVVGDDGDGMIRWFDKIDCRDIWDWLSV